MAGITQDQPAQAEGEEPDIAFQKMQTQMLSDVVGVHARDGARLGQLVSTDFDIAGNTRLGIADRVG